MDLVSLFSVAGQAGAAFTGVSPPTTRGRIFGGLVVAQALVAARRTVADRPIHSLHAYFLRPGDPLHDVEYRVEMLRDGRSFSARRVSAVQSGRVIFEMMASFQAYEPGLEHSFSKPDVPGPDELESLERIGTRLGDQLPDGLRSYFARKGPVELRPVDIARYVSGPEARAAEPKQALWVRCVEPIPQDECMQAATLAYISDMTLLDCALVAHGRTVFEGTVQAASIDHAIWFLRPFNPNDWHLYSQESPAAISGRGLARGSLFTAGGDLVASIVQEGLIRPRHP